MADREVRIWINTGEVSGDMHGGLLMKEFKELADVRFMGMAGPDMEAQGAEVLLHISELSIMGFTEVLSALPRVARLLARTWRLLKERRPDAVVLIDNPEYNFLVARMARRLSIPVFYYISPQVWAWRRGRVRFLSGAMRRILCILPFEEEFYRTHGAEATFVGHPLLDAIPLDELDVQDPAENVIGILPGSRSKEISMLLPEFARVASLLAMRRPDVRFRLFRAPGVDGARLERLWGEGAKVSVDVELVEPEDRYRSMRGCTALLAASGTVTLEAALIGAPTVVAYRVSDFTFFLARRLVQVDHISLPNIIMGERVFPEFLQEEAVAERLAGPLSTWLEDADARGRTVQKLHALRRKMGEPGAARRAARLILQDLTSGEH